MTAAAYNSTMIIKGLKNGKTTHMPVNFTDVNGAFATFPDGTTALQLGADQDYAIVDWIVVTGGTDTTSVDIFKNNLNASIQLVPKANLNTSNNRQLQSNPVGFAAGSKLMFKQNT